MTMQSIPNPFLDDVFCGGLSAAGVETVETIHAEALRRLGGHVMNLGGGLVSVMLLRSSRAGCGKSHLLSRLVSGCGGRCFFVPLEVNGEELPGFIAEPRAVDGAEEITSFGGWKSWMSSVR